MSDEPNNEGRELIITLPNSWGNLINRPWIESRVTSLAERIIGKNNDYQFTVHWNENHTNLHEHLIFSERKVVSDTLGQQSIGSGHIFNRSKKFEFFMNSNRRSRLL